MGCMKGEDIEAWAFWGKSEEKERSKVVRHVHIWQVTYADE